MSGKGRKKLDLKSRLKDKRERAKIELIFYGVFILVVIIFIRVMGNGTSSTYNNGNNDNNNITSFIYSVDDNYEYHIDIIINDKKYEYYGKVLGNNSSINLIDEDEIYSYRLMNRKYYELDDDNFVLVSEEDVYPYIDYRYLNISTIKEYLQMSVKEGNVYKVRVSDLILNSDSNDYITINVEEGDNNIIIDYSHLLEISDENLEKVLVNITYDNIESVISLEE